MLRPSIISDRVSFSRVSLLDVHVCGEKNYGLIIMITEDRIVKNFRLNEISLKLPEIMTKRIEVFTQDTKDGVI